MRVAMMLYAGFQLLEVSGPMDVFHQANRLYGGVFYESHLIGPSPGPVLASNGTAVGTTECLFDSRPPFDLVVVPGSPVPGSAREHRELVDWLSDAGPKAHRLACISNGAFLLASAGLADRRWLNTHWRDADRLAAEYPLVHVVSNPGCLKDGNLYSSGGASAAIHLALSLVREDLGEHAAGTIATALLTLPERNAGCVRRNRC
ncbi:AraC family transcriptional regulator [Paraburkholderia sp. JPY432]|uniref:AraC family transcriptional regulator n=1 Tax=Paraburkholderia youngii TaxID=2782701 RepID=UPI001595CBAC|nr:AraC family transcriptional regulator [Paraburkholderia youngii]NVH76939.1 AraC family transcriptional regulator [Paraburkholderia youngii]